MLETSCTTCGKLRATGVTFHNLDGEQTALCLACHKKTLIGPAPRYEMHSGTPVSEKTCDGCKKHFD